MFDALTALKKLKPDTREQVVLFMRSVTFGMYGTTKRSVMAAAKQRFGPSLDWDKIKPILEALAPILLALLL